ncbi:unnamed protein product [Schistosoma bovis]|nr:unnamed protein product [Schistosoma bovis]
MYTNLYTRSVLSKTLLILIWLHEQDQIVFGFNGYINYDLFGIKNDEIIKSSMICVNQHVYNCKRNSNLRFNDSVLFQNNKSNHNCDLFSVDINQDLLNGVRECISEYLEINNFYV